MHHPAMKANCTKTRVTGYLKTIKICFALLLERALERYQRRQRRVNLRDVEVKLRRLRISPRRDDRGDEEEEEERGGKSEKDGMVDCCWGRRWDRYVDVDIFGVRLLNERIFVQVFCRCGLRWRCVIKGGRCYINIVLDRGVDV